MMGVHIAKGRFKRRKINTYHPPISSSELLERARPYKSDDGYFVWFASGGQNWGMCPERGVIPYPVSQLLHPTVKAPPGLGGAWYATEQEALKDLKYICDSNPGKGWL